jgi:hypothetical protein
LEKIEFFWVAIPGRRQKKGEPQDWGPQCDSHQLGARTIARTADAINHVDRTSPPAWKIAKFQRVVGEALEVSAT